MSTATTPQLPAPEAAASVDTRPAPPGALWPTVAAVLALLYLAVTSSVPRATQLGVVALVGAAVAAVALSRSPRTRGVVVTAALLTLFVAVPVTRVPGNRLLLLLVLAGAGLLGVIGVLSVGTRSLPRGSVVVSSLFAALTVSTVVNDHPGGLVALALVAVAGPPVLLVAGSLDQDGRRDVAVVVIALAVVQALIAVVEPWLLPSHLWAPAQLGSSGQVVPLTNEVLGSVERSQGTLGHPLPLGLLLVVALALTARLLVRQRTVVRLGVQAVLLAGLVFAGARSSIVMAVVVLLLMSGRRMTPARVVTAMTVLTVTTVGLVASTFDLSGRLAEVSETGSWQHRIGALQSVGRLLLWQDMDRVLLGNGYGSTSRVMADGLLQNDGFAAVDNQFVLVLSQGGLLALALLVALLVTALFRGEPAMRPAVLCAVATLMVFDVLLWPGAVAVLCVVLGLALAQLTAAAAPGAAAPDDAATADPARAAGAAVAAPLQGQGT